MHADVETYEVYVQMTLQPLSPGDNVPPPLTSFEATGFPSELLREVVSSRSLQPKSSSKNVFTVVEFAPALQEAGCFSIVLKCALALVAAATATLLFESLPLVLGQGLSVVAKLIDSLVFSSTPNNELDLTDLCCV
ncbi:unnamed protein product [Camellia sinensis]